jgi:hypothetical protein
MADEEQKASEEYSTNPNTMRARARKQKLQGEAKIQDAARTADYKAMLYARNSIREKPEYKAASDMAKQAMLEEAMRETMEKRFVALAVTFRLLPCTCISILSTAPCNFFPVYALSLFSLNYKRQI